METVERNTQMMEGTYVVLPPSVQIIRHFDLFRYIYFTMHLDIMYIEMHLFYCASRYVAVAGGQGRTDGPCTLLPNPPE